MKYILVNPFNPAQGNGVNSYYASLKALLGHKYDFIDFSNNDDADIVTFRKMVKAFIDDNFDRKNVIIEAPETRAATLLLGRDYKVHIRLHTPLGTCQKYEGNAINQARFSDELRVVAQAQQVSAPSYGIANEIDEFISSDHFVVNKNPILTQIQSKPKSERDFDVVFMGRFHKLKGSEYLNAFISALPENYKVALIGAGLDRFKLKVPNPERVFLSDHIEGDARFDYLTNAKAVMVPSLFENCSMMVLEALSAGVSVVTWKVGGNDEFPQKFVKSVAFDSIEQYAGAVIDTVKEQPIDPVEYQDLITEINADFVNGFESVYNRFTAQESEPYRSSFAKENAYIPVSRGIFYSEPEEFFRGKKVFGFTISNEHIEEMWAPILHYLGLDYRLVCRRPLGFHSKFRDTFPIDPKKFSQYDWIANPSRIVDEINRYRPDFLLTHNGSHPSYAAAIEAIKELNIPIIYTELGWFPQDGNIYVDRRGVNGASIISSLGFESLTGHAMSKGRRAAVNSRDIFIPAQLNNDTNIKVFSPRFRSIDQFVEYVIDQTDDDRKVLIKPHPLDREWDRFQDFSGDRIEIIDRSVPISEILSRVGHVASLNSTVMLEALSYKVNIYSGGQGILSNKGIAVDLINNELRDCISDSLIGSKSDRERVIAGLQERQINLMELANRSAIDDGILPYSLHPIAEAVQISTPKWRPLQPAKPVVVKPVANANAHVTPVSTAAAANGAKPVVAAPSPVQTYAAVFKKGCQEFHNGNYDAAVKSFTKASTMAGSSPAAFRCLAEAYVQLNKSTDAIKALQSASIKLPDNKNIRKRIDYLGKPKIKRVLSKPEVYEVPV